jgi:hypothetical protein
MRCQAVTIGSAQGSAALAADEAGGRVQDAVAQRLRLPSCEVSVQGQPADAQEGCACCPMTTNIPRLVSLTCDEETPLSIHGDDGVRFA